MNNFYCFNQGYFKCNWLFPQCQCLAIKIKMAFGATVLIPVKVSDHHCFYIVSANDNMMKQTNII